MLDAGMTEKILECKNSPADLEKLYNSDPEEFKRAFDALYPEHTDNIIFRVWQERLHYNRAKSGSRLAEEPKPNIFLMILLTAIAGLVLEYPVYFNIKPPDAYYMKYAAFALFPFISFYLLWHRKASFKTTGIVTAVYAAALLYARVLPSVKTSDTLTLVYIHMPFFLWSVFALAYLDREYGNYDKRSEFLRMNGEMIIYGTLLGIAGGILMFLTFGLFMVIGARIQEFYIKHIALYGLAAIPLFALYLSLTRGKLSAGISPLIARIISPFILATLIVYLFAILSLKKNPYADRNFLLTFNLMEFLVLAVIILGIAEKIKSPARVFQDWVIMGLLLCAVAIDAIALSAIIFRLSSYGLTPNRLTVLTVNVLMLVHLLGILKHYISYIRKKAGFDKVEAWIVSYLPVYSIWAAAVAFLFPVIFNYK